MTKQQLFLFLRKPETLRNDGTVKTVRVVSQGKLTLFVRITDSSINLKT